MKIIKEYCSEEIIIKKSKFLAELFNVKTQEEARNLLKMQKEKYPDAAHVVHAFVIGDNAEILGCSDDGEPQGTAGRPAIDVLKNSGITNIMVTVARRFGGILLGTGGLVKAYSESVKAVLEKAETEELVKETGFTLKCSYQDFEKIKRNLESFGIKQKECLFYEEIQLKGVIPKKEEKNFCLFITESTKGTAKLELD